MVTKLSTRPMMERLRPVPALPSRFCKDCRHIREATGFSDWTCGRPMNWGDDPVTGKSRVGINIRDAYYEREHYEREPYTHAKIYPTDLCGPPARFFEPK